MDVLSALSAARLVPVVERCREHGVLALPGAVTATEIQEALELGVTTVKFKAGDFARIAALTAEAVALAKG